MSRAAGQSQTTGMVSYRCSPLLFHSPLTKKKKKTCTHTHTHTTPTLFSVAAESHLKHPSVLERLACVPKYPTRVWSEIGLEKEKGGISQRGFMMRIKSAAHPARRKKWAARWSSKKPQAAAAELGWKKRRCRREEGCLTWRRTAPPCVTIPQHYCLQVSQAIVEGGHFFKRLFSQV